MNAHKTKRTSRILTYSFGLLLALPVTGCGHFKRPSTVVNSVYMECNDGEYSKVQRLFAEDMLAQSDTSPEANGQGIKMVCDRLTNSSTVTQVNILNETILGDRAEVVADLQFQGGGSRSGERTNLVKEDGAWKVTAR